MLSSNRSFFLGLVVVISGLTACSNSPSAKNLEQSLAADPRLQNNSQILGTNAQPTPTKSSTVQLPTDFPPEIPLYANAQLTAVQPASGSENRASTQWQSSDPSNFIANFYRNQFKTNNWQIVEQPTDDVGGTFVARRNDLEVKVNIKPQSVTTGAANQPQTSTELQIEYSTSGNLNASNSPQPGDPQFIGPVQPKTNVAAQPQNSTVKPTFFSDLNKLTPQWQQHIQDLAALGVLTTETNINKSNSSSATNQFEPGKIVTRREFARWLVAANNAMYANNPAKQIRLASETNQPTFKDVPATDGDFPAIQGLAEAGLIPSALSGDATAVLFRPDAPLTREQLILWKLPLDTRQALPNANLEAVKQTWGFQDAEKIDPKVLRAIFADYQNAEQANIRRVFGYTTLLQPKKPVTRGEAAISLWYFGTQGEGISATEALKLKS
ncbi:S-layer domain protein [Richelia sinica FACHB-800]|uniref:S-layer domain protein n=1 Tax=Richelia sinica FACHB-800 TaxID=1357546 RepID=A0A975Y349_9NOST|nr:S-layer homology domain-containing protein [Richelia sinica]MBD2662910.1 S-layer homology domain-containing protein [Richelia sinica FACHB-800]QXE21750.1 S-layer domain protein [Richelia sinica FACHB-800]